jgi:hypothetical protein
MGMPTQNRLMAVFHPSKHVSLNDSVLGWAVIADNRGFGGIS